MATGTKENGLGLSTFLSSGTPTETVTTTETTPDITVTEGTPKTDETPVSTDTPKETTEVPKEVTPPKEKPDADEKPVTSTEDKKAEPEAKLDWEADDNPYKKRYRDTKSWANALNQANLELKKLQQGQDILNKKLDGTYDPERDAPVPETPEQIASRGELQGRVKASDAMAYQLYGKESVESTMSEFNKIYGTNNSIQMRVLAADAPTVEAMKVMREHKFFSQYGADPDAIVKNIETEVLAKHEKLITERVTKQVMERLKKKEEVGSTLSEARNAGEDKAKEPGPQPLSSIFGR